MKIGKLGMRVAAIVLGAAVIPGVSAPVSASFIIDQDQPSGPLRLGSLTSPGFLAQSFQTQDYESICGAGILLEDEGLPGDITIFLYDALPTEGGNILAQATDRADPGGWFDVFWADVPIVPDTTYYLTFFQQAPGSGLNILGDVTNPYPHGIAYAGTFASPTYNPFPDNDFAFRTWVPEPGTAALALLGAGLVLRRRR